VQIFITVCVCSQFENLAFVYTAVVLCGSEAVRIEWIYFGARWCARHPDLAIAFLVFLCYSSRFVSWWRGTVVERRSLTGVLSLSCTRPAADG